MGYGYGGEYVSNHFVVQQSLLSLPFEVVRYWIAPDLDQDWHQSLSLLCLRLISFNMAPWLLHFVIVEQIRKISKMLSKLEKLWRSSQNLRITIGPWRTGYEAMEFWRCTSHYYHLYNLVSLCLSVSIHEYIYILYYIILYYIILYYIILYYIILYYIILYYIIFVIIIFIYYIILLLLLYRFLLDGRCLPTCQRDTQWHTCFTVWRFQQYITMFRFHRWQYQSKQTRIILERFLAFRGAPMPRRQSKE